MNEKIDPRIITRNDTGQKEINKKEKIQNFTNLHRQSGVAGWWESGKNEEHQ